MKILCVICFLLTIYLFFYVLSVIFEETIENIIFLMLMFTFAAISFVYCVIKGYK